MRVKYLIQIIFLLQFCFWSFPYNLQNVQPQFDGIHIRTISETLLGRQFHSFKCLICTTCITLMKNRMTILNAVFNRWELCMLNSLKISIWIHSFIHNAYSTYAKIFLASPYQYCTRKFNNMISGIVLEMFQLHLFELFFQYYG